jgi:hypothetical protein
MHEHNQAAAKAIFYANNPSRDSHVLLLHGLSTNEAIPLVRNHIARLYNIDSIKHIVILTGLEQIPQDVIQSFWPAAERAMREFDVDIQYNKPSDGVIYIKFGDSNGGDPSDNLLEEDFLRTDIPVSYQRIHNLFSQSFIYNILIFLALRIDINKVLWSRPRRS